MKIERPNVQVLSEQDYRRDIQRAANVCYASTREKCNTQVFVDNLVKAGHGRPLEFGTIYLMIPRVHSYLISYYANNRYSMIDYKNGEDNLFVITNYRVLSEAPKNVREESEQYRISSIGYTPRKTLLWHISRGIADEFRTHTMISSLMSSTRYINYAKDKFGSQITFIRPTWFDNTNRKSVWRRRVMKLSWWMSERFYMLLIKMGARPQEARDIFLGFRAEFIQCAFTDDWKQFFAQRAENSTGAAHPDAYYIANIAKDLINE